MERDRSFTRVIDIPKRAGVGTIESTEFALLTCQELEDKIAAQDARQEICSCLGFEELEELARMRRELEERQRNGQC